jgi:diguanylate cyclase (GGDEF)-like protein
MAHHLAKAEFLLFGIVDQDVKVYEKAVLASLEEVWSSWKVSLLEAVTKILKAPASLPSAGPAMPPLPPLPPLEPLTSLSDVGKPLPKRSAVRDINAPASVPTTAGKAGDDRRRPVILVDEVTRLFNKDYFEECLAIEVERAKRYARNISLLYLGVTPHQPGMSKMEENVVATQVAEILALSLRKVDVICRLETNQYGIILPDTADNTYGIIAKRVFKFFKQVMGDSPSVFLNISASTYPKHAGNHLLLMKNAADLLEQARQVGPNKAVLPE